MQCDYCEATESVVVFIDMSGTEEDIHICQDCYAAGLGPFSKTID